MKTIDDLLHNGTESEQEFVTLAQAYPAIPERILQHHFRRLLATFGAMGTLSSFLGYGATQDDPGYAFMCAGASGLAALTSGVLLLELRKNILLGRSYRKDPSASPEVSLPSQFYTYQGMFTATPTIVEATLADPVYPIETLDAMSGDKAGYFFLGRTTIESLKVEPYIHSEVFDGMERPVHINEKRIRARVVLARGENRMEYSLDTKKDDFPRSIAQLHPGDHRSFLLKKDGGSAVQCSGIYPVLSAPLCT